MRWNIFHRIGRIRRVYQPRHTAFYRERISARLPIQRFEEQMDKAEKPPPALASSFLRSLNARGVAESPCQHGIGYFCFCGELPRCRSPPLLSF